MGKILPYRSLTAALSHFLLIQIDSALLYAQVKLAGDGSQGAGRLVKARLERTQLGQVCKHIKAMLLPGHAHIVVRLDMRRISKLSLDVTAMTVKLAIMEHPKLKIKDANAVR